MMKAVEYYEKYGPILSEQKNRIEYFRQLHKLFIEFSDEAIKLYNDRHCDSSEALRSIIFEQNQKWNALIRIFEKHDIFEQNQKWNALSRIFVKNYGASPLNTDFFKDYWLEQLARNTPQDLKIIKED